MRRLKSFIINYWEPALHACILIFVCWRLLNEWLGRWANSPFEEKFTITLASVNFLVIFYLNVYFLIPKFLKPPRWLPYCLALGFSFFGISIFGELVSMFLDSRGGEPIHFLMVFLGTMASFAYTFTRDWILNLNLIKSLKEEKQSMELAFLKSQIDPHFLFNTLNNLYALALEENAEKTGYAIARLGTLMRYNLHDATTEFIPIQKEIDHIRIFIELQRLRLNEFNKLDLDIDINQELLKPFKIAPMMLIPFIENAFKYGISQSEPSFIKIEMRLEETYLTLKVENKINTKIEGTSTGVGLKNVKKRLSLIYPEKYELDYGKRKTVFYSKLKLNLGV
ncbi:MAG: histidine kinase [Bacteroidota bacterium]